MLIGGVRSVKRDHRDRSNRAPPSAASCALGLRLAGAVDAPAALAGRPHEFRPVPLAAARWAPTPSAWPACVAFIAPCGCVRVRCLRRPRSSDPDALGGPWLLLREQGKPTAAPDAAAFSPHRSGLLRATRACPQSAPRRVRATALARIPSPVPLGDRYASLQKMPSPRNSISSATITITGMKTLRTQALDSLGSVMAPTVAPTNTPKATGAAITGSMSPRWK